MKQIGIWIDRKQAKIVSIIDGKDNLHTIQSEIEDFHVKGGSGSRIKGGPQDVVQDSKYLERQKHQLSHFFQSIIPYITNADAIVITGPAQTGNKLKTELSEKHPLIHEKVVSVEKADSMTDIQIVIWAKGCFVLNSSK